MKIIGAGISILITMSAITSAQARISASKIVSEYEKGRSSVASVYMAGVYDGLLASDSAIIIARRKPIFCLPPTLAITVDQNIEMIKEYLDEQPSAGQETPASILLMAYRRTFPCPK